jgi:hypothetical protein
VFADCCSGSTVGTIGATYLITPEISDEARANYSNQRVSSQNLLDSFGGSVPRPDSALFPWISSQNGYFGLYIPGAGIYDLVVLSLASVTLRYASLWFVEVLLISDIEAPPTALVFGTDRMLAAFGSSVSKSYSRILHLSIDRVRSSSMFMRVR